MLFGLLRRNICWREVFHVLVHWWRNWICCANGVSFSFSILSFFFKGLVKLKLQVAISKFYWFTWWVDSGYFLFLMGQMYKIRYEKRKKFKIDQNLLNQFIHIVDYYWNNMFPLLVCISPKTFVQLDVPKHLFGDSIAYLKGVKLTFRYITQNCSFLMIFFLVCFTKKCFMINRRYHRISGAF